jgi:redox-sensitive bicupin YhaK (pirin superfamily)
LTCLSKSRYFLFPPKGLSFSLFSEYQGKIMNLMRANPEQLFEYGPFNVRRQRPGEALSPLLRVDLMTLRLDARIPMQQYRDEDIFTYVWRGSMLHQDSQGERTPLSAKRLMLVNAGAGTSYEESVPLVEASVLQAVIRPAQSGGESRTQVMRREQGAQKNLWTLLAGPENSEAPLILRQTAYIYDVQLERGQKLALPEIEGLVPWLTVLEGIIHCGEHKLAQGDAISDASGLPLLSGERDASLICLLIKPDNPA